MQGNKISHRINDVDGDYAIQRKHMFEKICLQNNSLVLQNTLWIWQYLWYPLYNPVITYVLRRILTMGIFTGHMSRFLFISLSLLDYNALITWICGSQLWSYICFCANMGQPQIEWQRIVSNWVTNFYDNIVGYIICTYLPRYLRPRLIIFLI